jgi:hypothetical protein
MDENWTSKDYHGRDPIVIVLAIDVIPYYIEAKFLSPLVKRWFVVGNNYPTYPGVYKHIDNGGLYTVIGDENGDAIIENLPNGSGTTYRHPLRIFVGASQIVTVAHNTFFYASTDRILEHIFIPKLPCTNLSLFCSVTQKSGVLLLPKTTQEDH